MLDDRFRDGRQSAGMAKTSPSCARIIVEVALRMVGLYVHRATVDGLERITARGWKVPRGSNLCPPCIEVTLPSQCRRSKQEQFFRLATSLRESRFDTGTLCVTKVASLSFGRYKRCLWVYDSAAVLQDDNWMCKKYIP